MTHYERHRLRNLTLLCASGLTVMAGTPVAPALPTLAEAFQDQPHADLLVRLILTMPSLFIGLIAPASGWLVDRVGRRPLLLWGTVLYAAAGSTGLYFDSLPAIVAGRAVLGVAVSAIMTAAVTLVGDYFTGPARQRFLGLQAAFMSLGGMVFLIAGGALADVSWRGPFAVYLGAIVVVPMAMRSIREPLPYDGSSVAVNSSAPVGSPSVIGLIYAIAFAGMIAFYAVPLQLPFHLKRLTGANGMYVGLAIAGLTVFSSASSMLFPRIKSRLSFPAVIALTMLGSAAGYLTVALASNYAQVMVGMMLAGLGTGLLMPNLNLWLMSQGPESRRGRLVGGLTMSLFLGQFVSPIALRPIQAIWSTSGVFYALGLALLAASAVFAGYAIGRLRLTTKPRGPADRQRQGHEPASAVGGWPAAETASPVAMTAEAVDGHPGN